MIDHLAESIRLWGQDRGITLNSTAAAQFLKTAEEMGELAGALARDDQSEIEDAIGDIFVTLVMVATLSGAHIENCIEKAYNQIKDRKGYLTIDVGS